MERNENYNLKWHRFVISLSNLNKKIILWFFKQNQLIKFKNSFRYGVLENKKRNWDSLNFYTTEGKQLCLDLKYDKWNNEKANRLEEFTGIVGSENYDYCAEIGVTGMTDEPNPYR